MLLIDLRKRYMATNHFQTHIRCACSVVRRLFLNTALKH